MCKKCECKQNEIFKIIDTKVIQEHRNKMNYSNDTIDLLYKFVEEIEELDIALSYLSKVKLKNMHNDLLVVDNAAQEFADVIISGIAFLEAIGVDVNGAILKKIKNKEKERGN